MNIGKETNDNCKADSRCIIVYEFRTLAYPAPFRGSVDFSYSILRRTKKKNRLKTVVV